MEQQAGTIATVSSSKSNLFVVVTFSIAVSVILIITILLLTTNQYRQSSTRSTVVQSLRAAAKQSTTVSTTTTTLSPEELHRLSSFKEFLNLPPDHPNPNPAHSSKTMNVFMRSIYQQIYDERGSQRKKRQDEPHSNLDLADTTDFIISLPNQHHEPSSSLTYRFEYNASLAHLSYAELILPVRRFSSLRISSSTFNISVKPSFRHEKNWLKINLTRHIRSFPLTLQMTIDHSKPTFSSLSSGFLTLYFRRSSHSISRRQLSTFYDNQLITYPDDPSYCQVRPLRTSFSDLNWSSWIIEPSSYEMNVCSGTCHTQSNMDTYFLIQNLLHQKHPRRIPAPCCKPKRFSSTMLLYYDGPNLVLKRHEDMRVVECGCS